jgi:hypothetical protein
VGEFLSGYWLSQHLFCRGAADRFSALLSWTALNEILEHHWRETYRFRLACQGRDLEPASYADLEGSIPRIRAKDLTDQLRLGATLSFDGADEVHEPLRRLAESFEAFFHGSTQINVYAGWRALHGLDLHSDNQEIFILQLDGRKRWLLYGSSVDEVDRSELRDRSVPPSGALLDQILEPGDLLYIPRGCYHVAVPMNEPALHLTLGVVEQYLSEAGSNCKPRPSFSLPWSATAQLLPAGGDFLVRLNVQAHRVVDGDSAAGAVELRASGRRYRFPQSMRAIIEPLQNGAPMPIAQLAEAVGGELDEGAVRMLVGMLLKHGLVAIRARDDE